ncbi:FtsB family cell division protein [Chrysiogenes arsenatis]|uniref:FtsB family cell division protein n=1 Tax=Chrysiogenes arsenatis TaxID=309797 RepID=UPI0003FEC87A|nr:septum formation initiator family protein [Chrysiogenes arsenatis]
MTRQSFFPLIAFLFALGFFLTFAFNDMGYLKYRELQETRAELEGHLARLQYEADAVEQRIDRLQNDRDYLIQLARRILGMALPGERIIKLTEGEKNHADERANH